MSSLIEERISRNIARQQENFKRQQEIISSFNEDFLNSSSDNLVEPMVFLDELDMSLSQIRVSGKAFDGAGDSVSNSLQATSTNSPALSATSLKVDESENENSKLNFSDMLDKSLPDNSNLYLTNILTPTQGILQQQLLKVQQFRRASKEMQKTVFSLEQQLERVEAEKVNQKRVYEKQKSSMLRKFDAEKKKSTKQLSLEADKFEKLKADISLRQTTRLKRVNKERHSLEKQIKKLEGKVEILKTQNKELQERNEELNGKLHASDESTRTNLGTILDLRDQLGKSLTQIAKLEQQLQSKNKLLGESKDSQASTEKKEKDAFENERMKLAEQIATLTMELDVAKKNTQKVRSIEAKLKLSKSFEKKCKELSTTLNQMRVEKRTVLLENNRLKVELTTKNNSARDMTKTIKSKAQTILELKSRLEKNKKVLEEYEALKKKHTEQIEGTKVLMQDKDTLTASLIDCKKALEKASELKKIVEEVPALRDEIEGLHEKLRVAEKEAVARENEITSFESQVALHETENNQLHEDLTTERNRASNFMEKFTILEIENDRLKRELEELEEKNNMIAQLENAVNMKDGLIEELKNEKKALKTTISELEEVHQRMQITTRALADAKATIKSLTIMDSEKEKKIEKGEQIYDETKKKLNKTFKALTLAMYALLPCMVRCQELATQKRLAAREYHRLYLVLKDTDQAIKSMNWEASENFDAVKRNNSNLSTSQNRKKLRSFVIAVIAANRLLRFAGIASSLIPVTPNAFYPSKNIEPYHFLGKKLPTAKNRGHINMYLATPRDPPKELPQVFLDGTLDSWFESDDSEARRTELDDLNTNTNALVCLINHFKFREKPKDSLYADAVSKTLDEAGLLFNSPPVDLLDGLLRGQRRFLKSKKASKWQHGDIQEDMRVLKSIFEKMKSVRSIEKQNLLDLEEKSQLWESDLKALKSKHSVTTLLVEEKNIEISALKKSIETLEDINAKLIPKEELNRVTELRDESIQEIEKMKVELIKEKDKHKKARKALRDLKNKHATVSVTLEEQTKSMQTLDTTSTRLKTLLATQKRINAKKSSLTKSMENKLNEASATNDELREKLNIEKRKNWEDRRKQEENMAHMTKQLSRKSKNLESLKAKLTACRTSKTNAEKELEELQEKYYQARKDHRKQMASIAKDISAARENHYPDISAMKLQIEALREEKAELRHELDEMHKLLKSVTTTKSMSRKDMLLLAKRQATADLEDTFKTLTPANIRIATMDAKNTDGVDTGDEDDNVEQYLCQIDKKLFQQYGTPSSKLNKSSKLDETKDSTE